MKFLPLIFLLLSASMLDAAPRLEGLPEELREFLHPQKQMVTLSDSAEKTAWTDRATVNIVVTTEKKKLADAMAENADIRQVIRDRAVGLGVPEDKINNSKFASTPNYGWFGERPESYRVVNRVAIEIESERQMQGLAELSDGEKAMEFSGVQFEHSEKEKFQQEVKQLVLDKIAQQKQFYEKSLGVKLIPVSFHDGMVRPLATAGAAGLEQSMRVRSMSKTAGSAALYSSEIVGASEPSGFDEVRYQAQLSVVYQILPN
jgi:uncharacterized protein YggE